MPAAQRNTIVSALGSGSAPHGHASAQILAAVEQAFVAALRSGFEIGAAVALVSSIAAWVLIERRVAASAPAAKPAPSGDEAVTPERTYSG